MSSKKTKSTKENKGNKKSPRKKSIHYELVVPDCWVNELAEIDINDGSWKCSVTIIEEESTDSSVYMEHFNESTLHGNRLSVKSISELDVIHYVVKNRAENHPEKSLTPLSLLCSEVFKLVGPEFKNKIPTPLLASLIKYLILEYKGLNKTIREGMEKRKKEFEEYQQSLWKAPVKSISSKGTTSNKLENKSNKLDKVKTVKTSEKPFTKLRKRGEEWMDKTWIDDSPNDGPQLYIAISTFYDPGLPLELLNLNIPLHAIAKLCLWETSSAIRNRVDSVLTQDFKDIFESLQNFRHKSTPHLNSSIRKRLGNENDKNENPNVKISNFWEIIDKLKTELPTALMFKNIMFLHFTPDHFSFQYEIKSFQGEIYKQISYFLYDVHEIAKQHIQYLSEIKQTNVYTAETFDLLNMKIYQSLLDSVPHESFNVPFILDAIIIQVCSLENEADQKGALQELEKTDENEKSIPIAGNYLTKLLKQLNFNYDLFCHQFNYTPSNENEYKNKIDSCNITHVLKHIDDVNIKTFHLQEDISEFVRKRTFHILKVAWNDILVNLFSVSHSDDHVVKLCSEITKTARDSGENTLNYYIYILTVNNILNSLLIHDFSYSTLKINSLKGSVHYDLENMCEDCILEVHSDIFSIVSFIRNTFSNLSNMSSKVSLYNLSDEIIDSNLFYIEYMSVDVMLQWIQTVWYNFNKLETRYCPFTNQVVMVFHNLLSPKVGVFEENWIGKLTTYVPVRDFVEYILEEEKNWLSQFNSKSTVEGSKLEKDVTISLDKLLPYELPLLFPEHQFLSHRSLKYETMMKQQKSEKQIKVPSTEKSKSTKNKAVTRQSDTSKKSKGNDKQKERKMSENKIAPLDSFKEETPNENFTFVGYDLGDPMRFQFSGLKKEKIIDDCCRITLQTVTKLYGEKTQALTVTLSGHSLYYMYKPYCESTLINPFHLVLSSGIVIYFGLSIKENIERDSFDQIPKAFNRTDTKQDSLLINNSVLETEFLVHQTFIPALGENTELLGSNDFTPNEWNSSNCFRRTLEKVPYFEIPLTYDLKLSLPNGLHVELAKDSGLFYVRQTLLSRSMLAKGVDKEKHRCYLSNGCIVKFLSNDTIEILTPNGLLYTVFEIKEEQFRSGKEDPVEPPEGTIVKSILSEMSVRKNKRVSLKEKTEESSKSLRIKTGQKNDKKSTDSHTPTTTFINTEKSYPQEMEENAHLANVYYFECTTSNGKRFTAKNNEVTEVLNDLLITHTVNVAENCIDSERTDRVLTKHLADGSLLVQFTDGSLITSTPLQAGEVFCEWSSEELNQWFSDSTNISVVAADSKTEKSFSKTSERSFIEKSVVENEMEKTLASSDRFHKGDTVQNEILPNELEKELKTSVVEENNITSDFETIISKTSTGTLLNSMTDQYLLRKPFYHEDGFVVYHVSYLMEHPNYGSVYYNANDGEVELKLPLNTNITLKNDGCYEAYFDRASLTVEDDEIYFGKVRESGDFERTIIINNSAANNKNPVDFSNYFNRMTSLPRSVDEFCQSIGIKSLLKGMVMKTDIKSGLLLYCVDSKINEIIVDYDFNIYELPVIKGKYITPGNSYTAMVINENLSGFRLVSDEEVNSHVQLITENGGLLQETDNALNSLFTTVPVVRNELEKWLMNYLKDLLEKTKMLIKSSTYGKRESWIQPFVEKEEKGQDLVGYKAVIVRLLHKIPAKENILEKLKVAVKNYSRNTNKNHDLQVVLDEDFSLDELIRNPNLLCKIIKDENIKINLEKDQFRNTIKQNFLRTLINKAIIKARKIRKQNKEKELKSALRRKEIPPYHLSGFGYVHNILDEVFEGATSVCKASLSTGRPDCEKVNYIIDELLSLVSKRKLDSTANEFGDDTITNETDSIGIQSLVNDIFRNVYALTQDSNSKNDINAIMEKPLKLVTPDDIEFISKQFGSGDCPILYDEEFILKDVLDARIQLSNYFENLKSMLEFYRGISPVQYCETMSNNCCSNCCD